VASLCCGWFLPPLLGDLLMVRNLAALFALAICVNCVSAKEYKGTATKIDTDKKTVTVKIDDTEKTFSYSDSTEFVRGKNKAVAQSDLSKLSTQISAKGVAVTITTDEKDGKEVMDKDGNLTLTKVTIGGGKRKQNQ
jgi:hypothetical protein